MSKGAELPHNLEAERSVLGAMLIAPDACSVALGGLEAEDFSDVDPRNKLIFKAMKELTTSGRPVDVQTVIDELISLKQDKEVPTSYLLDLVNAVIVPDNIDHYIEMVHEQAVLRDFLLETERIQKDYTKGVPDIGEFIESANDKITAIASRRNVKGMSKASDVAKTVNIRIQQSSNADKRGLVGIDTGFRTLNDFVHGWQKGDLIILAARPSVGKTALGLNFAYNAALKSKCTVAFFSLEMSNEQIMERLIASRSSVEGENITSGYLNQNQKIKIASAVEEIAKQSIFLDDSPDSKLGDVVSKATKLKAEHQDLGLIVIDYLGRIRTTDRPSMDQRQQEVSYISGALKQLARNLNVPVICLAQLNRDVEKGDNKIPTLSSLRESGSIEQDADIVLLLYRADYYTEMGISVGKKNKYGNKDEENEEPVGPKNQTSDTSEVSVIVAKNRKGKTGKVNLVFQKNFSRFSDPSKEFQDRQAALEERRLGNNE